MSMRIAVVFILSFAATVSARAGKFETLYEFCSQTDCVDGQHPAGVMLSPDNKLYGVTFENGGVGGVLYEAFPNASKPDRIIHSFTSMDGTELFAAPIIDE